MIEIQDVIQNAREWFRITSPFILTLFIIEIYRVLK